MMVKISKLRILEKNGCWINPSAQVWRQETDRVDYFLPPVFFRR